MKLSSLIGHVVELYNEVSVSSKPADHLIDMFFRQRKYLGSHDRRFIAETLYAMLRHKKRIEWIVSSIHAFPKKILLQCAVVLLLESKESKEVLSREKILPEDILCQLQANVNVLPSGENVVEKIALTYSCQEWMVERWLKRFGEAETIALCSSLNKQAPLTLRVNTIKTTVEECQHSLRSEGIDSERTLYSPFGLRLQKRINVFQLETFRKVFFEVQDEGSQLLALLVNPKPRTRVIDACAGAGGKSLAMAALMKNRGEIFSLDIHEFKLNELRKRVKRAGVDSIRCTTVKKDEAPAALRNTAEYVLIDAPCSGTGTIRRNPGMKWSVTPAMISELCNKQRMILENYSHYAKENGIVVYATCSLLEEENEKVVEGFLEKHPEFLLMSPKNILAKHNLENLANNKYFQLLPHCYETDGFFACVMKRIQ